MAPTPKRASDGLIDAFLVRCSPEQKARWMALAKSRGLGLASWVRMTLLDAEKEQAK